MSVVKLNLIKIKGPRNLLDAVVKKAAENADFAAENAADVVRTTAGCVTVNETDPYASALASLTALAESVQVPLDGKGVAPTGEYEDLAPKIQEERERCSVLEKKCSDLEGRIKDDEKILEQLNHMIGANIPLDAMFSLEYFRFRFGRMPYENYMALDKYSAEKDNYFFFVSSSDKQEVFGMYIVPTSHAPMVDALFKTMHFERIEISNRAQGTPAEAFEKISEDLSNSKKEYEEAVAEKKKYSDAIRDELNGWYTALCAYERSFKVKRTALLTPDGFILCGYAEKKKSEKVAKDLCAVPGVTVSVEEPDPEQPVLPPTKLKNPWFFRPFEEYVRMYGMPSYNELDPTPLVALSYMLFFGIMFGDVGQGAVIILAGMVLWFAKKMFIGRILTRVGIMSVAFGFVYGSVFGYEDILPFGFKVNEGPNINITLFAAVFVGVVMISVSIFMNILNGIRQKDLAKALFSNNSVASLVFYWAVLLLVLGVLNFVSVGIPVMILVAVIIVCLALIMMRVPLGALIKRRKKLVPTTWIDYLLESFFDLFETILSFVTNTISYIRLGAFALNHVGMMSVIFLLSETTSGQNPVIVVIGNLFVIGFEGMIVCIQALRLEFYEIFGRFYDGRGREFITD